MQIKANQLTLAYGKDIAVNQISFEINEPKIYGLLGRNGAGKTSLLSMIASFREPTSGEILINNEIPFENAKIMKDVILMYDKDFTGETHSPSALIEQINTYRPNFDLEYAKELIKKFKLEGKKSIAKLSKGKQSAFNVVVGLASRAPITIFDEVYLGMDAPSRDLFYKELLKDQEKHPRIIIMSTHLVSEMEYLFDEVIIIDQGKLLLQGTYDEVVSRGVTVIGHRDNVNEFTKNKHVINEEQLGDTKSATIFGELSEADRNQARKLGLQLGSSSLQDLFIQLTKEDE